MHIFSAIVLILIASAYVDAYASMYFGKMISLHVHVYNDASWYIGDTYLFISDA